ncbi:MAG TPA: DUF3015 domain-containing protein [Nitrospiria bacterium]|nr:DUF3015 domain-containing protein [Nitrospiria bacterium]
MKKYILAIIGTVLFSSSAFAAGYGDAGCGLGSLLFGNQAGPVQILAATTNNTFLNQAFGISSGTSNCDAKGFDTTKLEQEQFVANNYSGLAKDMATGQGEQLATLAGLMGCPTAQQPRFDTVTQQNYQAIFASDSTTPTEVLTAVRGVVSGDSELSTNCSN